NGARTFQRGSGSANRPGAGGVAAGDIIAEDNQSVTLRLRDGSSLIVFYSPSTKVMKSTEGSMTDLVTGASIMIQGTQNSDGSITAQSIQVRPASQQNASGGGR
ncbi:hypothetical protein KGQ31_02390, partial [Patescibacteria group bacterium]|nr:hypothetical protein [Patescibacteria group bacterium]